MSTTYDTTGPDVSTPAPPEGWEASADAIVNEIQRPRQYDPETVELPDGRQVTDSDNEWRWLPKMDLPGFEPEDDECGQDIIKFCSCCGETTSVGRTCRRSVCKRCAKEWCLRRAVTLTSHLKAAWAYQYASLDHHPYFHHMVLSPPSDWQLAGDSDTVYTRTLGVVKSILDHLDMPAVVLYHPYRGSDEQPGDDRGEWKSRVLHGQDWEDIEDELKHSPHFHVVGISPHVDISVTEEVEKRTGWTIHRITRDDGVSVGNDWDLARVVSYCLSHVGIDRRGPDQDNLARYHRHMRPLAGSRTSVDVDDQTREQMDAIVRTVAPQTLDIPSGKIQCQAQVGQGEGEGQAYAPASNQHDDGTIDGGAGDGDGDGDDDLAGGPESDPDTLQACRGKLMPIWDAPSKLSDDDWCQSARYIMDLRETYQEWQKDPRWVGAPG